MVLHIASFVRRPTGAHALQARRICPVGRARRKDTSYRHRGPGWKILGPYSDARGPGGGRAARTAARDPRKRPAAGPSPPNILATPTLAQPQKFSPSAPLLSGIVAHTRIRKVSCCFYDGDGPPTAAKTSAHGLTHGLAAASGDCTSTALDATARLRGVSAKAAPPWRGRWTIECDHWRADGPRGPVLSAGVDVPRRFAFAAERRSRPHSLPHTRRGTNASLRSLASFSAADHAPPTPKISPELRRS